MIQTCKQLYIIVSYTLIKIINILNKNVLNKNWWRHCVKLVKHLLLSTKNAYNKSNIISTGSGRCVLQSADNSQIITIKFNIIVILRTFIFICFNITVTPTLQCYFDTLLKSRKRLKIVSNYYTWYKFHTHYT